MSVLNLIPVWFVLALLIPSAIALGGVYRRSKARRTVTCPETSQSALIAIDRRNAVLMHVIGDHRQRIRACSRWPERRECAQDCLARAS
jgi:hypothetical protein